MHNLEIKCRYPDLRTAERLARAELHADFFGTLVQTDTYFHVRTGRLKLRRNRLRSTTRAPETTAELILYTRPDRRSARSSSYEILPVASAARTLQFLTAALGVRVVVRKARRVYLRDNLRVHLDTVAGLGKFLEFELIVSPEHPLQECRQELNRLLTLFRVGRHDLLGGSYSEMLLAAGDPS